MAKSFAVAMLIVGTVIGAGFASGREIVSFFGLHTSPFTAVLCGIVIFLLSAMFLFIGSRLNSKNVSEVNVKLTGRFHFITDAFLLVNNLIVLAGMLAGMDSLGASFFSASPLYSIGAGILCVLVVCKGIKGILNCNKIVVPFIVVPLFFVCMFTVSMAGADFSPTFGSVFIIIVYICMNMMLASTVLTTMGKMDRKTILGASAIAAIIMGVLIFVLMAALNSFSDVSADMPVLEMAKKIHPVLYGVMVLIVAVSIFTTMLTAMSGLVSWFEGILGNKLLAAILVLVAGFILSNLGFSHVVGILYPIIGVLGVIYTVLGVIFALRSLPFGKAVMLGKNTVRQKR